jgi:hypothetical protein
LSILMQLAELTTVRPGITHSLRAAVEWFWLATAARRVRGGGNPHSTMLIHTTTETAVHEAFKDPLLDLRAGLLRRLDAGDAATVERLRNTWEQETARVPAEDFGKVKVPFDEVLARLREVVRDTRVIRGLVDPKPSSPPTTTCPRGGVSRAGELSRGHAALRRMLCHSLGDQLADLVAAPCCRMTEAMKARRCGTSCPS